MEIAHMTVHTFTTAPLINAGDLADNPTKALRNVPESLNLPDSLTPLQRAIVAELNRFPGWPAYHHPIAAHARETALQNVEGRARQWEATTGKPLPLTTGFAVPSYVENLRQLFQCRDIEGNEALRRDEAKQPAPTLAAPFEWHENLAVTLEKLQDPAFAIRFALDHVDPGMVRDFMEDWQDDHDAGETARVAHWLGMLEESIRYGQMAEAEEVLVADEPDYSDMRAFNRTLAAERRERKAQQQ